MKLYVIILSLLLQGWLLVPCVKASEADFEWNDAVRSAQQGEPDFAFMGFQTITQAYPNSKYALAAEFAQAEYFFLQNNFDLAASAFKNFFTKYPQRKEALAALGYLFKIAQIQKTPNEAKQYRHRAASFQQLAFIFNEKKSFEFLSGFGHKHKLVLTIDKMELYVNGKLFSEVPF
ncbi:MAG: hypothetical protein HQL14_06950 [Candidatus Omnitrophica bacterium]|nr:hypothetical protein [Candidatus Omnitrophota bacterium]